jgi:hypothetical protein
VKSIDQDNIPVRHGHIVEETLGSRGTVGQRTSVLAFTCLSQTVSTGVPEDIAGLGVAEGKQDDPAVLLQNTVQIPQFTIDLGNDNIGADVLGNITQERGGSGLVCFGGDRRGGVAVENVESDGDFRVRLVLD